MVVKVQMSDHDKSADSASEATRTIETGPGDRGGVKSEGNTATRRGAFLASPGYLSLDHGRHTPLLSRLKSTCCPPAEPGRMTKSP